MRAASRFFATSSIALIAACGASTRVTPTRIAASAPAPDAATNAESPMVATFVPALGFPERAGQAGGTRRWTTGALRVEVTDADVRIASDWIAPAIGAVVPLEHGFAFVGFGGDVFASETFTGPLRRVEMDEDGAAALNRGVHVAIGGRGRVALVDAEGGLWLGDGQRIDRAYPANGEPALDAVFADAERGAVVIDGGSLWSTDDGGENWRPVALADAAADYVVVYDDGALIVGSGAGRVVLDAATGRVSPVPPGPGRTLAETPAGAQGDPARIQRAGIAFPTTSAIESIVPEPFRRADGTRVTYSGRDALVLGPGPGATRVVERAVPDRCVTGRWGELVVARCDAPAALHRSEDGLAFTRVATAGSLDSITFSDDGLHAVQTGNCFDPSEGATVARVGEGGSESGQRMCALVDGRGRWNEIALPWVSVSVLAVHGGEAIVRAPGEPDADTSAVTNTFALVNLDTGAVGALRVADLPEHASIDEADGGWAGGRVYLVLSSDTQGLFTAIGAPDAELVPRPAAREARNASFADERHGIAAGRNLDELWKTLDRGETWTKLVVPFDGDPARALLPTGYGPGYRAVECDAEGCSVGAILRLRGWGDLARVEGTRFGGAPLDTDDYAVDDAGSMARPAYVPLRCERSAAAARAPVVAGPSRAARGDRRVEFGGAGAFARIDLQPGTGDAPRTARVYWRGQGADGALEGSSRRGPFADTASSAADAPGGGDGEGSEGGNAAARFLIHAASRRGLLFASCPGQGSLGCTTYWAANGGAITPVQWPGEIGASAFGATVDSALALPDGSVAVRLVERSMTRATEFVVAITPDGGARLRRAFVWRRQPRGRYTTLGVLGGNLAYVVSEPGEPLRWTVIPLVAGATPVEMDLSGRALHACEGPTPRDALRTQLAGDGLAPALEGDVDPWTPRRAWIEVRQGVTCLRALDFTPGTQESEHGVPGLSQGLRLEAQAQGRIGGVSLADDGRWHPLTCTPHPRQ